MNKKMFILITIISGLIISNIYLLNKININDKKLEDISLFTGYKSNEDNIKEEEDIQNETNIFMNTDIFINHYKNGLEITNKEQLFSISQSDTYYILFYMSNEHNNNQAILKTKDFINNHELYYVDISEMSQNDFFDTKAINEKNQTKDNFKFNSFPSIIEINKNDITLYDGLNNISNFIKKST